MEKDPARDILFKDSLLRDLSVVVGETGSGKTNLFQLIGMGSEYRRDLGKDTNYLLLWHNENSDRFTAEICSLRPDNLQFDLRSYEKDDDFIKLIEFETDEEGHPVKVAEIDQSKKWDTYIVNCFDKDAFATPPCPDTHDDGLNQNDYFPRLVVPFKRVNIGIACEHLHRYLSGLPQENIKRKAALRINAFNWSDNCPIEIDNRVEKRHYWTYREKRYQRNIRKPKLYKEQPPKYQFLHDLLADYALYLRKWAENAIDETILNKMKMITRGLDIPYPHNCVPDIFRSGASIPELLKRIEWLGSFIDSNFDDRYGERGLIWQISTDIKDIYEILNTFDDRYFTELTFTLPIVDMDFSDKRINDLFERMTAYHDDEYGIFTMELLPYTIEGISSGEYQYAKTLGAIDEFCIRMKISHERSKKEYTRPNFILLLDEPDAYMHPELCRRFVSLMNEILSKDSEGSQVQILMSTHSPFMLSDVVTGQVIRLQADEYGYCRILPKSRKSTFAAGIHSIMANDFFLKFTIGEYSREVLMRMMGELKQVGAREKGPEESRDIIRHASVIVPIIGDKVMQHYFSILLEDAKVAIIHDTSGI